MALVLDCSVIVSYLFEDERHPYSLAAQRYAMDVQAWVPSLFWYEIINVLLIRERKGKLQRKEALHYLALLEQGSLITVQDITHQMIFDLAHRYRLTSYDAAYLALAKQKRTKLATLDEGLKKAAISENLYYNPA